MSPGEPEPGPDWRGRFPFPLGAPSWVHGYTTDNVRRNVAYLSRSVDQVQLLLFGKDHLEEMLEPGLLAYLAAIALETGLRYSLHLPADLYLLDVADQPGELAKGIELLATIREHGAGLAPTGGVLHLDSQSDLGEIELTRRLGLVLDTLSRRFADAPDWFRIENTRHDLLPCRPLLESSGFGLCADFGHLWHHNQSIPDYLQGLGGLVKEIHLSGFNQRGDHLALAELVESAKSDVLSCVAACGGPVTLEIFQARAYWESVNTLSTFLEEYPPCHSTKPSSP